MTDLYPIPPGTRDILPDEMRELRALQSAFCEVFESRGYGQVATPTIEYDEVLSQGDPRSSAAAYRFFDERGDLLALRTDMTIPIARLAASRYASAEPPLRFFYMGSAYRSVRPQRAQMREFMQVGVELIGAEAPGGTAEVIEVLEAALDSAGLTRAVIGLGDADLFRSLLTELGVEGEQHEAILDSLVRHDLVGLETQIGGIDGLDDHGRETLLGLPNLRGGREILETAREIGGEAVQRATGRLQALFEELESRGAAERVQLDLGLLRDLGYYSGAILEVYDPALGHVLGGGGRYDGLLEGFGRDLPAVGFGLYLERVHLALAEEERIAVEEGEGR